MYTAFWYRFPHGKEDEPMQSQSRGFVDYESAIAFICLKSLKTRGIYWAGARVEDDNGRELYTITSDLKHSSILAG